MTDTSATDRARAVRRYRSGALLTIGVVVALAVAAVLAYLGSDPEGEVNVTCEGEVMAPGDACIVVRGGSSYDYEEGLAKVLVQRATVRTIAPFYLGLLGLYLLAVLATRFRLAAAPADTPGAQWHARGTKVAPWYAAPALVLIWIGAYLLVPFLGQPISLGYLPGILVGALGLFLLRSAWPSPPQLVRVDDDGIWAATGASVRDVPWWSATGIEQLVGGDDPTWRVLAGERTVDLGPGLSDPAALGETLYRRAGAAAG